MSRPHFFAALWLLACMVPQAFASSTFLYGFSITHFGCDNHPDISCPQGAASASVSDWSIPLGKLQVGLNAEAVSSQSASLSIHGLGEFGSITNQGFAAFNPARWDAGNGPLDLSEAALTGPSDVYYWLDTTFNVYPHHLTGSLYINNSRDELFMGASDSGTWAGFIRSDELGLTSSVLDFTGQWQFIGAIPEPGMVFLLMGAALAAAAVRKRKAP